MTSNAVSVDSDVVLERYKPSQTPSSTAQMPWARGTRSGVVAARSDFAGAFNFNGTASDVPLARRDWVFLPEGEVVTIDRVVTGGPSRRVYLRFRTPATLAMAGNVARGTSGRSALAIHTVEMSPPATPAVRQIPRSVECQDPAFGACAAARFAVGEYHAEIMGGQVIAVHVIDGLGASEAPAEVTSIAAPDAPPENAGAVGAMVHRGATTTFVVANRAFADGPSGDPMTYSVPGAAPSRQVVFDAPEDSEGRVAVTAVAAGGRCRITLGRDGAPPMPARPAIFAVGAASAGCAVTEDVAAEMAGNHADPAALRVLPTSVQPRSRFGSGCACILAYVPHHHKKRAAAATAAIGVGVAWLWWRRRPRRRH